MYKDSFSLLFSGRYLNYSIRVKGEVKTDPGSPTKAKGKSI